VDNKNQNSEMTHKTTRNKRKKYKEFLPGKMLKSIFNGLEARTCQEAAEKPRGAEVVPERGSERSLLSAVQCQMDRI